MVNAIYILLLLSSSGSYSNIELTAPTVEVHREGWSLIPIRQKDQRVSWPEVIPIRLGEKTIKAFPLGIVLQKKSLKKHWVGSPDLKVIDLAGRIKQMSVPTKNSPVGSYMAFYTGSTANGKLYFSKNSYDVKYHFVPANYPNLKLENNGVLSYLDEMSFKKGYFLDSKDTFARWRVDLLSSITGIKFHEDHVFTNIENAVSGYIKGLWKRAFLNIYRLDKGLSSQIAFLLTRCILTPDSRVVAAWITDPNSLTSLLSVLLNTKTINPISLKTIIEEWILSQKTFLSWPNSINKSFIEYKVGNASPRRQIFEIVDLENNILESEDIGSYEIGNMFHEISKNQPAILRSIPDLREPGLGYVTYKSNRDINFEFKKIRITPPGIQIENLYSLWNLPSLDMGKFQKPDQIRSTRLNLRKRHGRWEVLIFCETPLFPETGKKLPTVLKTFNDLQNHEAITLLFKDGNDSKSTGPLDYLGILTLGMNLQYEIYSGFESEDLDISSAVLGARKGWKVRVALPSSWIDPDNDGWIQFGALRSHGGTSDIETTLFPSVPWNIVPGMYQIDLKEWDRIPTR